MSFVTSVAIATARRWKTTLAALLVVVAGGLAALTVGLDREGFPPINTPISIVSGTYFVDDVERVDVDVVQALSADMAAIDGVIEVSSEASANGFVAVVEFETGTSSNEGTAILSRASYDLPPAATVEFTAIDDAKFSGEYDLFISVIAPPDATAAELQSEAEQLAAALVDDADVGGAEVVAVVTEAVDPATGEAETRRTGYARVALDPGGFTDSISIGIIRAADSDLDVLEFSDHIDERLGALADQRASGYTAVISADFAAGVSAQLDSLTSNLITGLIAVLVVGLVLIGVRAAAVMAGFMLLVMLGVLIGLWSIGYTLNTITLFGLILTLGLLVDNAVVVTESIDASRDQADPDEADPAIGVLRTAIDRVGSATLVGTLTTVVVFSPMLLIGGILGEFVRPIPATVIVTLLISFLFAIVAIPLVGRRFTASKAATWAPAASIVAAGGRSVGRLAHRSTGTGVGARLLAVVMVAVAVGSVAFGVRLAAGLDFSIFPAGKDANGLIVSVEFDPGTDIETAQDTAVQIDALIAEVVGDDLVRAQYVTGDERSVEIVVDLTPLSNRDTTAPEFVATLQTEAAGIDNARVAVKQVENAPPIADFPFAVQLTVDDSTLDSGQVLANEIRDDLDGRRFASGDNDVRVVDAIISTDGTISRLNGERFIEVRAKYDDTTGLTGLLTTTEDHVRTAFPSTDTEGLASDAMAFDFGEESDNQDDFAALNIAGIVALLLMLVLITAQFRSLAQSLLVFLAIPFTFLGVTATLTVTNNPLSFLAAIGFIALIGVSVNNTILLVDAANQHRRTGSTPSDAIALAITQRFRPLITTTLTTLAGLLPLALAEPFWESLAFTLMGGLVTSTILVLVAFPVFYVAVEALRAPFQRRTRQPVVTTEVASSDPAT